MVSEIKGSGLSNVAQAKATIDNTLRKAGESTAPSAARSNTEVVTLTDLAARLQRLTESVASLPEVDQMRVAELREQIDSGTYAIDEQQIAEKLAAFEGLLGTARKA